MGVPTIEISPEWDADNALGLGADTAESTKWKLHKNVTTGYIVIGIINFITGMITYYQLNGHCMHFPSF